MDSAKLLEPIRSSGRTCGAKTRTPEKNGKPCGRPAGWGTGHLGVGPCKLHGGSTKNGEKNGQKRLAEANARRAAGVDDADDAEAMVFGDLVETDPASALLEELWRTQGVVLYIGNVLAEDERARLTQDVETAGGGHHEAVSALADVYHRERQHLLRITKTALSLGLQERQVSLAEQQAQMVVSVIQGVLRELDMAHDPRVPGIVQRQLQAAGELAESD